MTRGETIAFVVLAICAVAAITTFVRTIVLDGSPLADRHERPPGCDCDDCTMDFGPLADRQT